MDVMNKVYVLVYTTSENDFDVCAYANNKVPQKIIKNKLKEIEGDDRYDIMVASANSLCYIDQQLDIVVEYRIATSDIYDE